MTVWLFIHLRAWSTCEKRGTAMAAGNRSLNIWNLLQSFHPDKSVDPRINISSNTRSVQTTESLGISQLFQATWQLTRGYLALISWFCVMWNLSNRFHVVVPLYSCTVQLYITDDVKMWWEQKRCTDFLVTFVTSFVINCWTDTRQHGIYLLIISSIRLSYGWWS